MNHELFGSLQSHLGVHREVLTIRKPTTALFGRLGSYVHLRNMTPMTCIDDEALTK